MMQSETSITESKETCFIFIKKLKCDLSVFVSNKPLCFMWKNAYYSIINTLRFNKKTIFYFDKIALNRIESS